MINYCEGSGRKFRNYNYRDMLKKVLVLQTFVKRWQLKEIFECKIKELYKKISGIYFFSFQLKSLKVINALRMKKIIKYMHFAQGI